MLLQEVEIVQGFAVACERIDFSGELLRITYFAGERHFAGTLRARPLVL
jgi:hypothetical protein